MGYGSGFPVTGLRLVKPIRGTVYVDLVAKASKRLRCGAAPVKGQLRCDAPLVVMLTAAYLHECTIQ